VEDQLTGNWAFHRRCDFLVESQSSGLSKLGDLSYLRQITQGDSAAPARIRDRTCGSVLYYPEVV
jgi:hypothetical protein